MPYIMLRNLFGRWCWEERNLEGALLRESATDFQTREECEADARKHGCTQPGDGQASSGAGPGRDATA